MSTIVTPKPGSQLWGIYHTGREHARELGDPLRTVVEAPNKLIAEETAAQLGFGDPWAHPVTSQQVRHAQWLHKRRPGHRAFLTHTLPHLHTHFPSPPSPLAPVKPHPSDSNQSL